MLADGLTKSLGPSKFEAVRNLVDEFSVQVLTRS